jgi:hypothetical protein
MAMGESIFGRAGMGELLSLADDDMRVPAGCYFRSRSSIIDGHNNRVAGRFSTHFNGIALLVI